MTKRTVRQFLLQQGWTVSYSGHQPRTMYVDTHDARTDDDIQITVVQHFGVLPDFAICKQK